MQQTAAPSFLDNPSVYEGTYLEFLGFRLTQWKDGFARLEMPVRPEHRNTVGYLHGGIISSLLDIAGAFSGSHGISNEFVSVTINLSTNFMAPHKSELVIAEEQSLQQARKRSSTRARSANRGRTSSK